MEMRRSPGRAHLQESGAGRRRDEVYGHGTRLRGVDLVEQIATNTKLQKQRWRDVYYRLWERKAKVDIADAIVIVDGTPRDWFFTSSVTGEVQRKSDAHLNAISIKRHFVRKGEPTGLARQIALLLHEDADGDLAYAVLSDLDFNLVLYQPASPLWGSSFLLQPFLSLARQHAQYRGTFVAKFNASTTSSIRVAHHDHCFHDLKQAETNTLAQPSHPSSSTCHRKPPPLLPRGVEELLRTETGKLVAEIEAATKGDALRQLHAEFQITRTHRLVLVRVARVVYASDLARRHTPAVSPPRGRPMSAGATTSTRRCAGGRFCQCKAFATGEISKTSTALSRSNDLQQITRRSLQLCDEESAFLDRFGGHAEARLDSVVSRTVSSSVAKPAATAVATVQDPYEAFKRVLQRRMFMLRSTLWNPESESFHAKPLAWEDEKTKQPQQYEMVRVCRTCYLIYHAMDAERFQATKSTVKAAARRLTMLHNAKMMGEKRHAVPRRQHHAWEAEDDDSDEQAKADDHGTPTAKSDGTTKKSSVVRTW